MIDGIVLAAGKSSRTGEKFKLTLPLGDKTVIEHTVGGMYEICDKIIVVVGHRPDAIKNALANYDKVEFAVNDNYEMGMFTSVKVGAAAANADKIFILPGDCPLIGKDVYLKMLEVNADIVIPTFHGRNGHPVLIAEKLADEILAEPDDSNLKIFLNKKGYKTVEIDEEGIILDVDTMKDYDNVRDIYERRNI